MLHVRHGTYVRWAANPSCGLRRAGDRAVSLFKGGGDIPVQECVVRRVDLVPCRPLTQKLLYIRRNPLVTLFKHLDPIIHVIGYVYLARRAHRYPKR